jgi:hypothetical protein
MVQYGPINDQNPDIFLQAAKSKFFSLFHAQDSGTVDGFHGEIGLFMTHLLAYSSIGTWRLPLEVGEPLLAILGTTDE